MYKQYEQPEMKIINLETEDIMRVSPIPGEDPDFNEGGGLDF